MPSFTRTPKQSRSEIITRLAGNANTVAALLSVAGVQRASDQESALMTCAAAAEEVARELFEYCGSEPARSGRPPRKHACIIAFAAGYHGRIRQEMRLFHGERFKRERPLPALYSMTHEHFANKK